MVLLIAPQTTYARIVARQGRKRVERKREKGRRIKRGGMRHERNIGTGDRVSWELAKRFVPPRAVPTELVCNSILSATERGKGRLRGEGDWNVNAGEYCVEPRENAFAPGPDGEVSDLSV